MKLSYYGVIVLLFILSTEYSFTQNSAAYSSLYYPHSIVSSGMGEQGAALPNASDAMQYNPANLIFTDGVSASYFRNPFQVMDRAFPVTAAVLSYKLPNGACVGFEYTNMFWGDVVLTTEQGPTDIDWYTMYERSIAGAFAMPLGTEWAVGAHIRYAWRPVGSRDMSNDILFSAGATYRPEALSHRGTFGFSFMNFGAPAAYSPENSMLMNYTDPMPAQINFAAGYALVRERYFDLSLALGFTKPLDKRDDDQYYTAQSSFKSLFTSWTVFPQEVTTHIGLGYQWNPLPLGRGVSFFQEMYLGYFKENSVIYNSFFTHGVRAGIEAYGVKASAGYAGRWHNNNAGSYMAWTYPWEIFQFTVSTNWNSTGDPEKTSQRQDHLSRIIVSGGYSYCAPIGRTMEQGLSGLGGTASQQSLWSAESDFYVNDNTAVIASLGYSRMDVKIYGVSPLDWGVRILPPSQFVETFALESGFRYHPSTLFHQFFVQASLGIMWLNPLSQWAMPRYVYNTFDDLVVGWTIPLSSTSVIVIPKVGLKTTFMSVAYGDSGLGGYSQFEFGLNVGYSL